MNKEERLNNLIAYMENDIGHMENNGNGDPLANSSEPREILQILERLRDIDAEEMYPNERTHYNPVYHTALSTSRAAVKATVNKILEG